MTTGERAIRKYGRLAREYESRWSFYVESTVRETLERLSVRSGDRVLDVACGTGFLLSTLAEREPGLELTGVDPTPEMLEVASRRLGPAARLVLGRAEALPFAANRFDVVVTTNSFHYFRHPAAALSEIRRVLEPGGRLVVTDWCDDYLACRLYDRVLSVMSRAHHRTYGEERCRAALEEASFDGVRVERYKINWLWGLMTATAVRRAA